MTIFTEGYSYQNLPLSPPLNQLVAEAKTEGRTQEAPMMLGNTQPRKGKVRVKGEESSHSPDGPFPAVPPTASLLSSSPCARMAQRSRRGEAPSPSRLLGTCWKPTYCFSPLNQHGLSQRFRMRKPFITTYYSPQLAFLRNKVNILVSVYLNPQPNFSTGSKLRWERLCC